MALGQVARTLGRVAGVTAGAAIATDAARRLHASSRWGVRARLGASGDLPEWVLPTDVLASYAEAEEHREAADDLGLPMVLDEVNAWAALGALAALLRLVDDGTRRSHVVDLGGRRSPLSRWCRALGFSVAREVPHERGSVDLLTRLHPAGAVAADVDAVLELAGVVLRPGGVVVVTVPVGDADAEGAMGRADLRALEARADGWGLRLVGDLDGEVGRRLTAAVRVAREDERDRTDGSAYALARLTLRRR